MLTTAYATGTTTAIFPSKGVHATCIDCGKEVISKCGTEVVHHFAHRPGVVCNTRFHDGKTDWHIRWQRTVIPELPGINVEVPITEDGSVKRADIISKSNYVIEFQHSHLPKPERIERENHYKNIIWVVHTDKKNSKTWKHCSSKARVFFNGDDNIVHWVSTNRNSGILNTFTISKERFIKTVINNPHYTDDIFDTIELRQHIHSNGVTEKYNRKIDERETILTTQHSRMYSRFQLRSEYYAAVFYIVNEFESIERYHALLEADRLESIKTAAALKKEQQQLKDPSLLQEIQKIETNFIEDAFVTDKNKWIQIAEEELLNRNRERLEAQLKLERERELEVAKQINAEITNTRNKQMSKEMQERIRVDLIRVKGNIPYAAEAARERLKRLGIDYTHELKHVNCGSDLE